MISYLESSNDLDCCNEDYLGPLQCFSKNEKQVCYLL